MEIAPIYLIHTLYLLSNWSSIMFLGNRKNGSNAQRKTGKLVSQSNNRKNKNGGRNSNRRTNQNANSNRNKKTSGGNRGKGNNPKNDASGCPGSLQECVNDCVPLKQLVAYTACVKVCGKRCKE